MAAHDHSPSCWQVYCCDADQEPTATLWNGAIYGSIHSFLERAYLNFGGPYRHHLG